MSGNEDDRRSIDSRKLLLDFKPIDIGQFKIQYQATRAVGFFEFEKSSSAFEGSGSKSSRLQKAAKGFTDPGIVIDDKDERRSWVDIQGAAFFDLEDSALSLSRH